MTVAIYAPLWCTIPDVASHCTELVKCSCKSVCRNCKCRRNELWCTRLCGCDGKCSGDMAQEIDDHDISTAEDTIEDSTDGNSCLLQDVEEDDEVDNMLDIVFVDADDVSTWE